MFLHQISPEMQAKAKHTLDLENLEKRMNRLKRSSDQCKCRWRSGEENLFAMMKAFKVVVATRSTVGGHGAVRHAFAEVHPHVVATALLACHPKPGRHLCAMRMLPILPETQKTEQTHNLCLSPFSSQARSHPPRHVPFLYPLGLPTIHIPCHKHSLYPEIRGGYQQGWVYATVKTSPLKNFKYG